VRAGETLGFVGNTGNAITTPPHLHFGVHRLVPGSFLGIDPVPFLKKSRTVPRMLDSSAHASGDGTGKGAALSKKRNG
jgi:hypothetical protein